MDSRGFSNKAPYVSALVVEFRKCLDDEILAQINEMIIAYNTSHDLGSGGEASGRLKEGSSEPSQMQEVYIEEDTWRNNETAVVSVEFEAKLDLSIDENEMARLERLSLLCDH